MARFVLSRVGQTIAVLLTVSVIIFVLMRMILATRPEKNVPSVIAGSTSFHRPSQTSVHGAT